MSGRSPLMDAESPATDVAFLSGSFFLLLILVTSAVLVLVDAAVAFASSIVASTDASFLLRLPFDDDVGFGFDPSILAPSSLCDFVANTAM